MPRPHRATQLWVHMHRAVWGGIWSDWNKCDQMFLRGQLESCTSCLPGYDHWWLTDLTCSFSFCSRLLPQGCNNFILKLTIKSYFRGYYNLDLSWKFPTTLYVTSFSPCVFPKAKNCSPILPPLHGAISCFNPSGNNSFGSKCTSTCDEGFLLNGVADTACTSLGVWSAELPRCLGNKCKQKSS